MTRATTFLLACAVAALAAPPAVAGGAPQHKTVLVQDNFYAPLKLTVNRGSTITWRWPDDAGDVHDVKLGAHPKGARPFHSQPGAAGYSFARRLTVPGTYKIVCTIHPGMAMTLKVR